MSGTLKAGVVGVGYLGRFHAEKYGLIQDVDLVGVADISEEKAEDVACRLGVDACRDHRELIGRVDLVSVVVDTSDHFKVARDFLEAGVHVLLEKPITRTLEEADALIELARGNNLVLQVGHLERFNPAMIAAKPHIGAPLFIEVNRIGPFPQRGTDVDVVRDLMIHDLDIILALVGEFPKWIHSVGIPVMTDKVDMANVRMEFPSGCVANITASRVSVKSQRRIRIFQEDTYLAVDFGERKVDLIRRIPPKGSGLPEIAAEQVDVTPGDALESEIRAFIHSVRTGSDPEVTGEDGRRALKLALDVIDGIETKLGDWFSGTGCNPESLTRPCSD